jgi:hypothetical protein
MKVVIEGDYGELATVDAVRQVRTMKALKSRSDDKVNELAAKDEQIQQLQQQLAVRVHLRLLYSGKISRSCHPGVQKKVFMVLLAIKIITQYACKLICLGNMIGDTTVSINTCTMVVTF